MEVREIRLKTFKNAFAATLGVSTCLAHSFRFVRRKEKAEKRPLFHVNVAGRVGNDSYFISRENARFWGFPLRQRASAMFLVSRKVPV